MNRAILSLSLVAALLAASSGCGFNHLFRHGGDAGIGCESGACGYAGDGYGDGRQNAYAGCFHGKQGKLRGHYTPQLAPGPMGAQVTYPYYTNRGPRDFFVSEPRGIGN